MLQQDKEFFFNNKVGDFVIATGKAHSVREFLDSSFRCVGIDNWQNYVVQDPRYMRPAEVHCLQGDPTKAREILGWEPTVTFEEMITRMVENDIRLMKNR